MYISIWTNKKHWKLFSFFLGWRHLLKEKDCRVDKDWGQCRTQAIGLPPPPAGEASSGLRSTSWPWLDFLTLLNFLTLMDFLILLRLLDLDGTSWSCSLPQPLLVQWTSEPYLTSWPWWTTWPCFDFWTLLKLLDLVPCFNPYWCLVTRWVVHQL